MTKTSLANRITSSSTALFLAMLASQLHAAPIFNANDVDLFTIGSVPASWDSEMFPPSTKANIYWDADRDGVFGEAGENDGNENGGTPDLNFSFTIENGATYDFGLEGFNVGDTGNTIFTITNSDLTKQILHVFEGTTESFFDGTTPWVVDFEFNDFAYGNVVFNGGASSGGASSDHQAQLTFRIVPEPSALLLACGIFSCLHAGARRRLGTRNAAGSFRGGIKKAQRAGNGRVR